MRRSNRQDTGYRLRSTPRELPNAGGSTILEGYLTEDLAAATDTRTTPSTATATRLVRDSSGDLVDGETGITITNRDTTLSLDSGTYIQWHRISGENRIVWAACSADVSAPE